MEKEIIESLNRVNDNLWVGDVIEANKIINKIIKQPKCQEYKYILTKVLKIYKNIDKNIEGKPKELKHKMILSTKFKTQIEDLKIELKDAIMGSIIDYLERLREKLQNTSRIPEIKNLDYYKYLIIKYPEPKYEIRTLLKREIEKINDERLKDTLKNMGYEIVEVAKTQKYLYLMAFSQKSYMEITVYIPYILIILSHAAPEKQKIHEMSRKIVESITS